MKYKVGEYVEYDGEKCLIIGAYEESSISYDNKNNVDATVDVYYDLECDCGTLLDCISEENLKPYLEAKVTSTKIKLKNGATYKLRNNMRATYEEVNDLMITDEGISVPGHFYNEEGKCSAYPSFDITEELWHISDDDINEDDDCDSTDEWWLDWCDEQSEEYEEECTEKSTYPLTLKDKSGKYYITFNKGSLGWTFNGNLPEEIEEFLNKILNGGII
ncbi:MAG: hypothetical protein J6J36_02765 [Clostridia bacterium]|nr:hypothetical protein [Clostridia bacterium]